MTEDKELTEVREALLQSFPKSFINVRDEFIAHKFSNTYFCLKNCVSAEDIECKVLEQLSRAAFKSQPYWQEWRNRKFHEFMLNGINAFLETGFSESDMEVIYQYLGNCVNHDLTVGFVQNGMDIDWLKRETEKESQVIEPCPICGSKAFVMHDVVDGFEMGWSAGCPRFRHEDGIHGTTMNSPKSDYCGVRGIDGGRKAAIAAWNAQARSIKARRLENGMV